MHLSGGMSLFNINISKLNSSVSISGHLLSSKPNDTKDSLSNLSYDLLDEPQPESLVI